MMIHSTFCYCFAPLYPKSKRDSIILKGVANGKGVCDINNELYEHGEETL